MNENKTLTEMMNKLMQCLLCAHCVCKIIV